MLTIKDFNVGDTVYVLLENRGRDDKPRITERTVAAIGKKYLTVLGVWKQQYMADGDNYLIEKVECGERTLLFKSQKDAEDYVERCALARWLGCMSTHQAERYSIEQLRKVKEILNMEVPHV